MVLCRFFKCITIKFLFLFLFNFSFGQIDASITYRYIPRDHKTRIILDRKNDVKYILDTSHIYVEAIDKNGKRIWRTDPWKDRKLGKASERPIIAEFDLVNNSRTKFRDVIAINYDNLGFAGNDAKPGKIISIGQD